MLILTNKERSKITVNFDLSFYYKNNIKTTLKNKQHKVIGLFF